MPPVDADWPLVSIVFLSYNRRDELARSLEQVLGHLDYPAGRLEVIVVDNASADGTPEMLRDRFPHVRLIRSPENVGASAWNVGMTTARGDWRMILDDDCHISGDALKTAVQRAEEHHADLVSFHVLSGTTPGYSFEDEYRTGLLTFWGCAAMFSRRAIESEPFYDPRIFIWANEMELTMRLLDRGFRHLYLPEVEPVHMKDPNPPFADRSNRFIVRQHRKHHLTGLGNRSGRLLERCPLTLQSPRLLPPQIINDQAVARFDQVCRHATAHPARTDKSQGFHKSSRR